MAVGVASRLYTSPRGGHRGSWGEGVAPAAVRRVSIVPVDQQRLGPYYWYLAHGRVWRCLSAPLDVPDRHFLIALDY